MLHINQTNSNSSISNIDDKCIQPNAVDIRIKGIKQINNDIFIINEDQKVHRTHKEVEVNSKGEWLLPVGTYDFTTEHDVTIAEGEAGLLVSRSTLNRNGVYITSGLYDSGFSGNLGGVLHVTCGLCIIKPGTRIGQFMLYKAESTHLYDGDYGLDRDGNVKPMEAVRIA